MDTATNPINLPTAHEAAPRHINFAIIPGLLLTATIAADRICLAQAAGRRDVQPDDPGDRHRHCVS